MPKTEVLHQGVNPTREVRKAAGTVSGHMAVQAYVLQKHKMKNTITSSLKDFFNT